MKGDQKAMYKVLIADDESIIRNALAGAFRWQDYCMEIVALSKNGLEALEHVKKLRPDICLLDIQMPLLSGLELIEKLNGIDEDIVKVIISGHDEFEFARKAIELGVNHYILKPIDEGDFKNILIKIKQQLDEKKRLAALQKRRDQMLSSNRKLLRDELITDWILGQKQDGENADLCDETLLEYGVQFSHATGLVWVGITYPMNLVHNEPIKEKQYAQCRTRLEKHFEKDASFCFVRLFSDCFLLLCDACDEMRWNDIKDELRPVISQDNEWSISIHKRRTTGCYQKLPAEFAKFSDYLSKEYDYLPMVKRVKKYIEENYQDMQLRFSAFAEENNISLSYLSKLFKNETGMSCIDYLIQYRIQQSLALLSVTNLKICDISDRVGYSSQHYYCEAFKKVMGMAPSEYRRRNKAAGDA